MSKNKQEKKQLKTIDWEQHLHYPCGQRGLGFHFSLFGAAFLKCYQGSDIDSHCCVVMSDSPW